MMCSLCGDVANWGAFKISMAVRNIKPNYCPECGNHMAMHEFIDNLRKGMAKVHVQFPDTETVTDENGNELILDRALGSYKSPDMSVNLDKIDIEREMKIIEERSKKN